MQKYVGIKHIKAKPMTRLEYNQFRGWDLPADENGADDGYLVEYVDGGLANTKQFEGYVSWSPKDVFDKAYRHKGDLLSFGDAIILLKAGHKVARLGWNGKGMWLALSPGVAALSADKFLAGPNREFAEANGGTAEVLPCITMKTINAHGREAILMGWLASQTDMLSEDWVVVE